MCVSCWVLSTPSQISIRSQQVRQNNHAVCVCVCFCFRLNQLCCTKEIKAYGSGPCPFTKSQSILSTLTDNTRYLFLQVFVQAYQGLGCYGNKSKNSLLTTKQSKSSRKTQSRHVSREPRTPGDAGSQINLWVLLNLHKTISHPLPFVRTTGGLVITDYNCHSCRAEFTLHTVDRQIWQRAEFERLNVTQSDNVIRKTGLCIIFLYKQ